MHGLVDQGNSLVVVDHNTAIINAADQIIEIGPGAGADGGQILDQGSPAEISHDAKSLIAPFFNWQNAFNRPSASRQCGHCQSQATAAHGHESV